MSTTTIKPNGDGTVQWASTGSSHYTEIDEGIGAIDNSDYVDTETFNATEEFDFEDVPSNVRMVTSFIVRARVKLLNTLTTAVVKVDYSTDGGTSYTNAGYIIPPYETEATYSMSAVTGLRVGRAAMNKFRLKFTFLESYP